MNRRIDNQPVDVDAVGVLGPRHRSDQTTAIVKRDSPAPVTVHRTVVTFAGKWRCSVDAPWRL
ncbi:hypothetical protein [Janibacter indicus]|uniref:hypothetical protein n=1 Tax=Janibacter indicus TaxID=857417 RepID=UPI003D9A4870